MDSEVVGLGRYVRAVRRRGWIVVATILVFAVGAAGYVALRPAQYSATAQVLIKPYSAARFNEPVFTTEQVDTQVAVMQSLAVVTPVTKQLGLQESPSDLVKDVSAAAVGDTSIVSLTVTRDNAQQAAQIANAIGLSYLSFRAAQQPPGARTSSSGVIVNSALPPDHRAGTSPLRAGIFGAAVGLVIGCLIALLVARRDPSLADEAAVAEATGGLPVLGRVPKRRYHSGTLTLMERPGSSEALAYRFLATKRTGARRTTRRARPPEPPRRWCWWSRPPHATAGRRWPPTWLSPLRRRADSVLLCDARPDPVRRSPDSRERQTEMTRRRPAPRPP